MGMTSAEGFHQSTSVDSSRKSRLSRTFRINEAMRAVKDSLTISLGVGLARIHCGLIAG